MTAWLALAALAAGQAGGHALDASGLPVCGNRVIREVVQRTGCTLGDTRCWFRIGGFCTDYVERRLGADRPGAAPPLDPVRAEDVQPGDVALFAARAHTAFVEAVRRDAAGRAVAVDVSEYNFGTCWVDREIMVTDQFKLVNRRSGVPLTAVDGGVLRRRAGAR